MSRVQITLSSGETKFADEFLLRPSPVDYLNTFGLQICNTMRKAQTFGVEVLTLRQRALFAFGDSGSLRVRFYDE